MTRLLEHFRAMQGMARAYLDPGSSYVDRTGEVGIGREGETELFAADMIYMLDGPEQREAERLAERHYPTEDAYLAACRALRWRTAQLRQAGIEPYDMSKVDPQTLDMNPEVVYFPITEAFPGDAHRQIYHAWRRFPVAMRAAYFLSFMAGGLFAFLVLLILMP
jgi:hypothetical protein